MGGELASILGASNSLGTSTTMGFATRRPAGLARTSGRHPTTSRPTSWSTAWGSTNWTASRGRNVRCGPSGVWLRLRSDPDGIKEYVQIVGDVFGPAERQEVFGRQATEYSAWAFPIPISSPFRSFVERLAFTHLAGVTDSARSSCAVSVAGGFAASVAGRSARVRPWSRGRRAWRPSRRSAR